MPKMKRVWNRNLDLHLSTNYMREYLRCFSEDVVTCVFMVGFLLSYTDV